ncbi:aspartate/glutamate racemase family protein [Thalassobacillus pellis]|uniref:aspartate/glutamate racemase family protein n=1 Tax=Thalassobacillus pellis TaxID=748008 RepID=UPI00195FC1FA|nr:aspartate/glutamate racemase family protein [Thalassobacillus pellis]MBM7551544.1 aspartate/glutamate racemase [Thalassobacillus pellis]
MNKKIAILHTTPVTVEPLKKLAAEKLPGFKVHNFVDDSILPQLIETEGDISKVRNRLVQYAAFAEETGADVILNACSSVGEVVQEMKEKVSIPVVRIDEAMAEEAIRSGSKIGVVATLFTTLAPTKRLLEEKAQELGKNIELHEKLADEAYQRLTEGDKEGHDRVLAEVLSQFAEEVDVVVLAQASMAKVVETLPADKQKKFLSSPLLGMESVQATVERVYG